MTVTEEKDYRIFKKEQLKNVIKLNNDTRELMVVKRMNKEVNSCILPIIQFINSIDNHTCKLIILDAVQKQIIELKKHCEDQALVETEIARDKRLRWKNLRSALKSESVRDERKS